MHPDDRVEMRKEAFTMALYVAICLLAALAAVSESTAEDHVFEIVGGTTVIYGALLLIVAGIVVLVKIALTGH